MKKLGLLLLTLCGVALADTPLQVINGNTGNYVLLNAAGSGANVPTTGAVTSGNCAQYSSTTGALADAGFPCGSGIITSITNSDGTIAVTGTSTNPVVSRSAITGDFTIPGASNTGTLATVNSNVGTFQGLTVNAKGLVTNASNLNYVTGVTGTAPIVASGTTNPIISIVPATAFVAGSMAVVDKAFLNAFENATVVLATSNAYSNILCNGASDDTSAWNTLVSTVPDRSIVEVPNCTTFISGAVNVPAGKHLTFIGAGPAKTIVQSNAPAPDFFTLGDWYTTFQGFTFQGLNTTATNATALSTTATTLTVGSTTNFPASGSLYVQTNLGWTLASYTSITNSTTFAGVTTTTASTTVAGGPITVKTGGYAVNSGSNTHHFLRDVQFNYVYNGWLNNGTQCGITDSPGFGTVNYDLQFNGPNVNADIHNYTADGVPATVAHVEVEQAGSLLISDSDIIRGQSNLRLNPTSPNGVFGLYATNSYFDTATAVSGVANSGNGVLLQGTGNIQRIKISGSWMSSSSHDGFWCNSTAATLPTDIELVNDNIYSNAANGVDQTGCQDIKAVSNQVAGNAVAGFNTTPSTGSVTKLTATDNRVGPTGGIGANGTGFIAAAGAYGGYMLRMNDTVGNTTAAANIGSVTTTNASQFAITDNPGINPKGTVTTPTFPASTVTVTNTTGYRVVVLEKNGSTAPSVFTVNGVNVTTGASTLVTTGTNSFPLDPGGTIAFTYTVAPVWVWYAN